MVDTLNNISPLINSNNQRVHALNNMSIWYRNMVAAAAATVVGCCGEGGVGGVSSSYYSIISMFFETLSYEYEWKYSFISVKCIGRESNPGRPRGRRAFYHWTTDAHCFQMQRCIKVIVLLELTEEALLMLTSWITVHSVTSKLTLCDLCWDFFFSGCLDPDVTSLQCLTKLT